MGLKIHRAGYQVQKKFLIRKSKFFRVQAHIAIFEFIQYYTKEKVEFGENIPSSIHR